MQNYSSLIEELDSRGAYSMARAEKVAFLSKTLARLSRHHYDNCPEYKNIIDAFKYDIFNCGSYYDLPFLPVRLFKKYELKSVPQNDIIKTMTSSGTTGAVSRIFLDRQTSSAQQKTLVKVVSEFIGGNRLPMLILDTSAVIKDRNMFSARGAGILGFSIFGRDKMYAFDENMRLDFEGIEAFLSKHKGERILLFGFTFMIWQHFYKELKRNNLKLDLSDGVLFHGGGWKKLVGEKVSPDAYKKALFDVCAIQAVHDYYGMVEQTGCIYVECEKGRLHCSNYSDVIIRRPSDFSPAAYGERGIIQVVSVLPYSYPGHSLLTEDEGTILGEDDCKCGKKGKYFTVHGRLANAEIRGCGDTYAVTR
jgi:hypothetical protein